MRSEKKLKYLTLLLVFLMAILISVGCTSSEESSEEEGPTTNNSSDSDTSKGDDGAQQKGGTLTFGYAEEPDTLDVHKSSMNITGLIGQNFGGSLISLEPETREIVPYLAESYEVSDDGLTLTFKLRPNITFHDGTPLTASLYKETFDRALDPATGAVGIISQVQQIKEVLAPDELTLIIKLSEPSAPILVNLSNSGKMQPLLPSAIEKHGDDYGRNPVGVGPWKFKEWQTGQTVTLERNDDFKWSEPFFENKEAPYPDQMVYKFIKDYQTMLAALDSGSIDVAFNIEGKDAARYFDNKNYQVYEMDRPGIGLFMEMNVENNALKEKAVRQAINMSINKETIIQAVLSGKGSVAHGPIPPSFFGYDPEIETYAFKYNKDEAVKLLESDGWSKNAKGVMEKGGLELSFDLLVLDRWNQPAQIVQAMLKEIGIEVNIQTLEAGTLIEKATAGEFDMTFMGYYGIDPDILYTFLHSNQINVMNHSRVNNPELDQLLERSRVAIDLEERKKVVQQAQKIVVEEGYWVPIYTEKQYHIANKKVKGIKQTIDGLLFHDSWVSEE